MRAWLAVYVPALMFGLVVAHHAYQVSAHGLTRWKGGGFGMFSTIDYPPNRFLRLFIVTDQNETIRARSPEEFGREFTRAESLPYDPQTQVFVNRLAQLAWIRGEVSGGLNGLSAEADKTQPAYSTARLANRDELAKPEVRPIRVYKAIIHIYSLAYEPSNKRLIPRLLRSVESTPKP